MTPAESKELIRGVAQFVVGEIAYALKPLKEQIDALEKRIEDVEENRKHFGTYQRGNEYKRFAMVTVDGSLWTAVQDCKPNEAPGASPKWVLVAKGGYGVPTRRLPTAPRNNGA